MCDGYVCVPCATCTTEPGGSKPIKSTMAACSVDIAISTAESCSHNHFSNHTD